MGVADEEQVNSFGEGLLDFFVQMTVREGDTALSDHHATGGMVDLNAQIVRMPRKRMVVVVAVPEDKMRFKPGKFVNDFAAFDITEVYERLRAGRAEKRNRLTGDFGSAV